jgi:hypothetical protein
LLQDIQNIPIRVADDFVTNVDSVDQKSNYFQRVRGVRNQGIDYVCQKDFGTIHRLATANYPAPVVAGTATIHRIHTFHDILDGTDHEILVCIDTTNSRVRIYVDTSPLGTGTWLELTRTFIAKVNQSTWITPPYATTTSVVNIDTIKENGSALTLAASEAVGYIVYNSTTGRLNSAYITASTATTITVDNYLGSDGLAWVDNDDLIFFRTEGHFKAYLENTQAFTTTLLTTTPHFEFNPITSQRKVNVYYGNDDSSPSMRSPIQIMNRAARNFFASTGGTYLKTVDARWDMEAMGGGLIPSYTEVGTITAPITAATGAVTKDIIDQFSTDIIAQITLQVIENGTVAADYHYVNIYATLVYSDYQESDPILKVFSSVHLTNSTSYLSVIPKINFSKLNKEVTAIRIYGQYSTKAEVESLAYLAKDEFENYRLFKEIRIGDSNIQDAGTVYSVGSVVGGFWTSTPQGGYHVGDVLTLVGGSGDATVYVWQVDSYPLTQFTHYYVVNPGTSGYTPQTYTTTGGNGTGAYIVVTSVVPHSATPTDAWTLVGTVQYPFQLTTTQATHGLIDSGAITLGNKSIVDNLQHIPSIERTIKKPRYGITIIRSENPISIIDMDDKTLINSTLDGYGVVEDDNFSEDATDISGTMLRENLLGILPIKSLLSNNNQINVFRLNMREIIDTQSGYQTNKECDFYANRSAVASPHGLAWCGYSAIYFVPIGNVSEYIMNEGWKNFYDGTLKIDDGSAPYITDAYRAAIISGYDPTFREFWFHCQVNKDAADGGGSEYLCFRFSPENKRWTIRQLNIGASYSPLVAFSQRSDGTMSLVYATGILQYPNRTGTYQYHDDVVYGGATVGKGVPLRFKLVVGEIADKIQQNILLNLLPDYKGSSITTAGKFQVNIYANKETSAYDTQYFPVDIKEDEVRFLEERDNASELAIEVLVPASDLADVKDLDISTLYLGIRKMMRGGNI